MDGGSEGAQAAHASPSTRRASRWALIVVLAVALCSLLAPGASAATGHSASIRTSALAAGFHLGRSCSRHCPRRRRLARARLRHAALGARHPHPAAATRPAVGPTGAISGKVTAATTKSGLAEAEVCAYELAALEEGRYEEELEPRCVFTKASGEYTIEALLTGQYVIEFSDHKGNWVTQIYDERTLVEEPDLVPVNAGVTTTHIDAALEEGGVIEGTVTAAESGKPLVEIVACAADLAVGGIGCAETGPEGKYLIRGLPSGTYEVDFIVPQAPGFNYLARSLGKTVKVEQGKTKTGENVALATGGEIKGEVKAAGTEAPLEEAEVCAIEEFEEYVECTLTAADGSYTLERLPTGAYQVEFYDPPEYFTQFYAGKADLSEASSVAVVAGKPAVTGIDASMLPSTGHNFGGVIEGRVTDASNGEPIPDVTVCAFAPNEEPLECVLSEPDGDYVIEELPTGTYKVGFFDSLYFTQFYDEKTLLAEGAELPVTAGGEPVGGIDAHLRSTTVPPAPPVPPLAGNQGQPPAQSSPPPPGAGGVLSTTAVLPSLTVNGRLRVVHGDAIASLRCVVGPCHGTAHLLGSVIRTSRVNGHTVKHKVTVSLGSGRFSLAQGAGSKVKIVLDATGRRLLANAARHPHAEKLEFVMQGAQTSLRAVVVG